MRTVSLLRHAKSSWDDAGLADIDRPLGSRGLRDAPRMAAYIASQGLDPDRVLCSSAKRTRETLSLVRTSLADPDAETTFDPKLYLAEPDVLIARLRGLPVTVQHALLVGHNPGFQLLAERLAGSGERGDLAAMAAKFPTCGLAVIDFDIGRWRDLRPGDGNLRLFMSPKRLPPPAPAD